MWTFQRYAKWLESRTNFFIPSQNPEPPDSEPAEAGFVSAPLPPAGVAARPEPKAKTSLAAPGAKEGHRIDIEPFEGEFGKILKKPE